MSTQPEEMVKKIVLSPAEREEIEHWIIKYPPERRQSAVMAALRIVQDNNHGWLSQAHLEAVAAYLEIPLIAVQEVASFYSMYELAPIGRHKVCVCTNISCMLRGSDEVIAHLSKRLGIKPGETTTDGRFTLREVECLGACIGAPMMQIGRQYYENLTSERIDRILDSLE
ncbi:NADH:quinone oxidoreductase subunit E [Gammaproteobacteria bacterium]